MGKIVGLIIKDTPIKENKNKKTSKNKEEVQENTPIEEEITDGQVQE